MQILEKYNHRADKAESLVCVGLDTQLAQAKERFPDSEYPMFDFNRWIIDQTYEQVAAYKPNFAFYEGEGLEGWQQLQMTIDYLKANYPDVVTIADAKRGDIGSTNVGYARSIFDRFGFDAVTLSPYFGREALDAFLSRVDKACIILCRTSNPGAVEFQNKKLEGDSPLWEFVARQVSGEWNEQQNCMLVVGATYPTELDRIRQSLPEMTFLVPGVGTQGGSAKEVMKVGLNSEKKGLIINSSRGIINHKDPSLAARQLKDEINSYR